MTETRGTSGNLREHFHDEARSFGQFGYALKPSPRALDPFRGEFFAQQKQMLAASPRTELIQLAGKTADRAFGRAFAACSGEIVIPLSGGRDSRFVLAMALRHGLRDRVLAVTYGVPGMWDFDLPVELCRKLGVRHEVYDLRHATITLGDLKEAFDNGAEWTDLALSHINQYWARVATRGARAISGFMGDPAAGSHYRPGFEKLSLADAASTFDSANRVQAPFGRNLSVLSLRDTLAPLLLPSTVMSIPEQLDIMIRQAGYISRVTCPRALSVSAPLADAEWLQLMYGLPADLRVHERFYVDFLTHTFPREFSVGTANAKGMREAQSGGAKLVAMSIQSLKRRLFQEMLGLRILHRGWKYGGEELLFANLSAHGISHAGLERRLARILQRLKSKPVRRTERDFSSQRLKFMLVCNLAFASWTQAEDRIPVAV